MISKSTFLINILTATALITASNALVALTIEIDGADAQDGQSVVSSNCNLNGKQSFTSDGGRTVFTTEESTSNGTGIRMTAPAGETGFGTFGGIVDFRACANNDNFALVKGDEIWVRARVLVPSDWQWNSGRNKFFRFRTYYDQNGSVQSAGYNDLYIDANDEGDGQYQPFQFIYEGEQNWFGLGQPSDFFVPNRWKTIELYLRLDDKKASEGGQSMVRLWLDGRLVGQTAERRTLYTADTFIHSFNFFTYFGNETSPKNQSLYVDDLVITNETPAAVDQAGNRFIGMGDFVPEIPPKAPVAR